MLKVKYRSQFKKDYKRALKRGLDPEALRIVLDKLINNETLDAKYRDHQLVDSRKYKNVRECHRLAVDLLLGSRKFDPYSRSYRNAQ